VSVVHGYPFSLFYFGIVTAQVFRLKAEVYKTSRKARIKPFKTFSVSLPAATGAAQAEMNPRWARSPNASTKLVD